MAGIMSTTASFAFTAANSLGASGAIYGLFGALLYFRKYDKTLFNRIFGVQVLIFLAVSLFLGFAMPYIDNVGHIGGIAGGYLAARAVGLLTQAYHDKKRNSIICYAAYFAVLIGLVLTGMLT
jgi:rhomboid protease GluP